MTASRNLLAVALAAAVVLSANADDRRPLTEARSENGRFTLKLEPGKPGRKVAAAPRATLSERGADGADRARVRWERTLVNDVAPSMALIRDDGRYVVTLDEFRRGGARNALVIYGSRGELLRHFLLTDLLTRDDWRHVRTNRRSINWLTDARYEFTDTGDQLVLYLAWKRTVRVDLRTLRIVRDGAPDLAGEVPADVLAAIAEGDGGASAVDEIARKTGVSPEDVQRLIDAGIIPDPGESADDPATASAEETTADEITERIQALIEDAHDTQRPPVDVAEVLAAAQAAQAEAAANGDDTSTNAAASGAPEKSFREGPIETLPDEIVVVDEQGRNPNVSALPGITDVIVPMPNPEAPVDYVEWYRSHAESAGSEGYQNYQAAIDSFVPFEGDSALFDAALRGDEAALASPQIAAWLTSNQGALAKYHEATQHDYRGWPVSSHDGSLISILLPQLAPIRQISRAAAIQSRWLAQQGDPQGAVAPLMDALRVGAQQGQGPTLIEKLVGVAVQGMAADTLADSFAKDADRLDFRRIADDLDNSYQRVRPMADNIQMERAFILDSLQRMFKVDPSTGARRLDLQAAQQMLALSGDEGADPLGAIQRMASIATIDYDSTLREANQFYDDMARAVAEPFPAAREQLQVVEQRIVGENTNPLLKVFVPALSRAHFLETRSDATRRGTRLLAEINAYRQQNGAYPDSLDVLGDREFVIDPFAQQPFAYRRDGDSFVLYSLGGNLSDDGGVHDPRGDTNDFVLWPRPAKP
ncbi:MAG: hypothetical protein AB7Q17_11325 [Phycisphaerae bacterium]